MATYGLGWGSVKVTLIVIGSTASTVLTTSQLPELDAAVSFVVTYFHVKTTSSAVKALPSDHLIPGASFQVTLVPSAEKPPLALVGISETKLATGLPSPPIEAKGSVTRRAAS